MQQTVALPLGVLGYRFVSAGDPIKVLGWGYTNVVTRDERHEQTREGPQFAQNLLRVADMEVFDLSACQKINGYSNINKKICAVSPKLKKNLQNSFSCRGDSGGPVIKYINGRVVQIGLVSGGVGCGANENGQQNPSIFVDLVQYSTWINMAEKKILSLENAVETLP